MSRGGRRRQSMALDFPARGMMDAVSARDIPPDGVAKIVNGDLDRTRGRIRRRDAFVVESVPPEVDQVLDVFDFPIAHLPQQPPRMPRILIAEEQESGGTTIYAYLRPWWTGAGWDDGSWSKLVTNPLYSYPSSSGGAPTRWTAVQFGQRLLVYPAAASNAGASLLPLPPSAIHYADPDDLRFQDEFGVGDPRLGFVAEDLRLLPPGDETELSLAIIGGGNGDADTQNASLYWIGYLYDGFQYGPPAKIASVQTWGRSASVTVTVRVPSRDALPQRISHVIVYSVMSADYADTPIVAHELKRIAIKDGLEESRADRITDSVTDNTCATVVSEELVDALELSEDPTRLWYVPEPGEGNPLYERFGYLMAGNSDTASGYVTPVLHVLREVAPVTEVESAVVVLGRRQGRLQDPFGIGKSPTVRVLRAPSIIDPPDRFPRDPDVFESILSISEDRTAIAFPLSSAEALQAAATPGRIALLLSYEVTETTVAGVIKEVIIDPLLCSVILEAALPGTHTDFDHMLVSDVIATADVTIEGKSVLRTEGRLFQDRLGTTQPIALSVAFGTYSLDADQHPDQLGPGEHTLVFDASGTDYETFGLSEVTGGTVAIGSRWIRDGNSASVSFVDGLALDVLATLPTYEENAQSTSDLPWCSAGVAAVVGGSVYVGNVRYPDPDNPLSFAAETAAVTDILRSGYTIDGQAAPDFFDPRALIRVGGSASEIRALFSYFGRLGALTESSCFLLQPSAGAVTVQEERRFDGYGIWGRNTLAVLPSGPVWLTRESVVQLTGGGVRSVSTFVESDEFRRLVSQAGADAWGAYDARTQRYVLWFNESHLPNTSTVYLMDRSGAWATYRVPFYAVSVRASHEHGIVATIGISGQPEIGTAYPSADQTLDLPTSLSVPVQMDVYYPELRPAGGDTLARIVEAAIEFGSSSSEEAVTVWAGLLHDGGVALTGPASFSSSSQTIRGSIPVSARVRATQPFVSTSSRLGEIERFSLAWVPKGRVRSLSRGDAGYK